MYVLFFAFEEQSARKIHLIYATMPIDIEQAYQEYFIQNSQPSARSEMLSQVKQLQDKSEDEHTVPLLVFMSFGFLLVVIGFCVFIFYKKKGTEIAKNNTKFAPYICIAGIVLCVICLLYMGVVYSGYREYMYERKNILTRIDNGDNATKAYFALIQRDFIRNKLRDHCTQFYKKYNMNIKEDAVASANACKNILDKLDQDHISFLRVDVIRLCSNYNIHVLTIALFSIFVIALTIYKKHFIILTIYAICTLVVLQQLRNRVDHKKSVRIHSKLIRETTASISNIDQVKERFDNFATRIPFTTINTVNVMSSYLTYTGIAFVVLGICLAVYVIFLFLNKDYAKMKQPPLLTYTVAFIAIVTTTVLCILNNE